MKNSQVTLLIMAISIGLASCYEYNDSEDSDEEYHSDEVNHGFNEEYNHPSHEESKYDFKKEIKQMHGSDDKAEESHRPQKWPSSKSKFGNVKPVWEEESEISMQQAVQQVFGSFGRQSQGNQGVEVQQNPFEQPPVPENDGFISTGRVNEQVNPASFPDLEEETNGGKQNLIYPNLNVKHQSINQQQRFRRQASTENQADTIDINGANVKFNLDGGSIDKTILKPEPNPASVIEIDGANVKFNLNEGSISESVVKPERNPADVIEISGANVKFNLDEGSMIGIAKPDGEERENMKDISEANINREQGSLWVTTEPSFPQKEAQITGQQQEELLKNENAGLLDNIDPQDSEKVKCTKCALNLSQQKDTPIFTSSQQQSESQETVLPAISLINDGNSASITSSTEMDLVPLKIGSADGGLKFNQGMKTEFENGYNQGFKDGYHNGAKEGFDHGAKHACETYHIYEKGVAYPKKPEFHKGVLETGDGMVKVEIQGALAEVDAPAVTAIIEEEEKQESEGSLDIAQIGNLVHVNKAKKDHYCEHQYIEENGSGEHHIEYGEEVVQATESAVMPITEEEVVQVGGGNVTIVQEDAVAEVEMPTVTPIVQEEKKEVIKTNPTHVHKHWDHGNGDHDYHGHYHGYYHGHGDDYHHDHKDSYPHNSQYHNYHHGQMDTYAHGSTDHGYYHGNQGQYDPHHYHDYHHGPGWHHWDRSSEEDFDSGSSEHSGHKHYSK